MSKTWRNIVIMAVASIGSGWLGLWLNQVSGNTQPAMESLGALLWLMLPALTGLLLRWLTRDGWSDLGLCPNLPGGWKWYLLAIVAYPAAGLLAFGVATLSGAISTDGLRSLGLQAYLNAAATLTLASLVKNLFEEFAWRGYLTPRLQAAGLPPLKNHALVALIWLCWHIPYYLYFLSRADLEKVTPYGMAVFMLLGLLSLLPTALLFGELTLGSGSLWPAYVLHNLINGLSMPLILQGFIRLNGLPGTLLTPTNEGLFVSLLLGLIGLIIYRQRKKPQAQP